MIAILASMLLQVPTAAEPRRPLTPADALFTIRDVCGKAMRVRDMDGDGLDDLVIARRARKPDGRTIGRPEGDRSIDRIDLMSSKRGARIRTLWTFDEAGARPSAWDVLGATAASSAPELALTLPANKSDSSRIVIVSCETALIRLTLAPESNDECFGSTLVSLGDLDADGKSDFGVWMGPSLVRAGFVCARSGRDGNTLWRVRCPSPGNALHVAVHSIADMNGDGVLDVLAQGDVLQDSPISILSGKDGSQIRTFLAEGRLASPAGDLDGDGVCDLFEDPIDADHYARWYSMRLVSGATRKKLCELPYPDLCARYGVTVALGDVDGDGVSDIGLSEPNFNILGPQDPGYSSRTSVDLRMLTLAQAAKLESQPWCAFTWESGCAVVYSGRTHELIWGAWAQPGTRRGLGLQMAAMPDVNGDGLPELMVTDEDIAYVFAGPGRSASTK
jgi:hypothetical protein